MSKPKAKKRKLSNGVVVNLEPVPYEETPAYWLEKHHDLLAQREAARIEEERRAREEAKNIIVGGPNDKTNKI